MSQQPAALRLADFLEVLADEGPNWQVLDLSAAELRRLHAELAEIAQANEWLQTIKARIASERDDLLQALHYAVKQVPELITVPGIRAAIAKAEGEPHADC